MVSKEYGTLVMIKHFEDVVWLQHIQQHLIIIKLTMGLVLLVQLLIVVTLSRGLPIPGKEKVDNGVCTALIISRAILSR